LRDMQLHRRLKLQESGLQDLSSDQSEHLHKGSYVSLKKRLVSCYITWLSELVNAICCVVLPNFSLNT
jgi:hypothetical protein